MTKLIWSKGYTPDPARVQEVVDLTTGREPIEIVKRVTPLTKRERRNLAAKTVGRVKVKRKQSVADRKAQREATVKNADAKRVRQTAAQGRLKERMKRLEAEYRANGGPETPEALDKARAKIAPKIKSHFQQWVETRTALKGDRKSLREWWRSMLLTRKADSGA